MKLKTTLSPKQAPKKKSTSEKVAQWATITFVAATLITILLSLVSYNATDVSAIFETTVSKTPGNLLGSFGAQIAGLLLYFFGCSVWIIPLILAYCLRTLLYDLTWLRELDRLAGLGILLLSTSALCHCYSFELFRGIYPGGLCGLTVHRILLSCLTEPHVHLFLFMLTWAVGVVIARFSFISYLYPLWYLLQSIPLKEWIARIRGHFGKPQEEPIEFQEPIMAAIPTEFGPPQIKETQPKAALKPLLFNPEPASTEGAYRLPPVTLFAEVKEQPNELTADSQQRAHILEQKLERFGIKGKVVSISQGPAVTLFEYQPAIDTKISTILAREDDLALALQAMSLRIMAPIPGKSVIGFEVAHNRRKPILFSQLIRSTAYSSFTGALPLILGKDTIGHDVVIDLAALPHLLVAGSTGSGKSVGLHMMIMSLLCSKSPDEIKFIMIDPKRLEFVAYADIAHLIFPIVTDPRRAIAVLKWAVETMEERYSRMAEAGVRNCGEYNSRLRPGDEDYFPLLVIIIDELADLMMTAGKDVETLIARLAQMARAAGIHLIAATQRPSVDVITGLIKVNFPSRIAYKVTSKVDSRTILDMIGAEKLLGKGDMLFSDTRTVYRVHGAYASDAEIQSVVAHIKSERAVVYKELMSLRTEDPTEESDELFHEITQYLQNKDEISISHIQRVFRIGYNRSARIIDQLETCGYLLPADGSKMRKVTKDH